MAFLFSSFCYMFLLYDIQLVLAKHLWIEFSGRSCQKSHVFSLVNRYVKTNTSAVHFIFFSLFSLKPTLWYQCWAQYLQLFFLGCALLCTMVIGRAEMSMPGTSAVQIALQIPLHWHFSLGHVEQENRTKQSECKIWPDLSAEVLGVSSLIVSLFVS